MIKGCVNPFGVDPPFYFVDKEIISLTRYLANSNKLQFVEEMRATNAPT